MRRSLVVVCRAPRGSERGLESVLDGCRRGTDHRHRHGRRRALRGSPRHGRRHRPGGDRGAQVRSGDRPPAHRPRARRRPVRIARQGDLALRARHQLQPHAACSGTASSSTIRTLAASTGRRCRSTASSASRWCAGRTRRSTASSAVGGVVQLVTRRDGERSFRSRAEGGSNDFARPASRAVSPAGRSRSTSAGHLRRGDGEVDNDFYDGEEIDLAAGLDLGSAARLSLLVRGVGSEIGIPFDFSGAASPHRVQELDGLSLALPFTWTATAGGIDALVARTESDLDFRDPDDPFAANRRPSRAATRHGLPAGSNSPKVGSRRSAASSSVRRRRRLGVRSGTCRRRQDDWAAFGQVSWRARTGSRSTSGAGDDDNDVYGSETSLAPGRGLGDLVRRSPPRRLRRGVPRAVARRPLLPRVRQPRARAGARRRASSSRSTATGESGATAVGASTTRSPSSRTTSTT